MAEWLQLLFALVGIVVTLFCFGAVPFGFSMHGRLSGIESTLNAMAGQRTELDEMHGELGRLTVKIARLEEQLARSG